MRKMVLLLASVAVTMVVAGGVAWAATIKCPNGNFFGDSRPCFGTPRADTMRGTAGFNAMYGKAGADTLYGRGGWYDSLDGGEGSDKLYGGKGHDALRGVNDGDKLFGGPGPDVLVGVKGVDKLFGGPGSDSLYPDNNRPGVYTVDDYVHGGTGDDFITASKGAIGGVDRIYGEDGNDHINVSQRRLVWLDLPVSKAIVDCGPGTEDSVIFDEGVDVIKNCETKFPY
jgi:Ca2+-binding RTX toxin-like protein